MGEKKINTAWSEKEINILKQFYTKNGIQYCLSLLNKSKSAIYYKTSILGLKVDKEIRKKNNKIAQFKFQKERPNNDFKINVDQFLDITSKEVVYFLGFFWADGYLLTSRNELRFSILDSDMNSIKNTLDKLGQWNYNVRHRTGFKKICTAITSNRRLCEFMIENDYDKKSFVSADKILTKIPDELKHYFFRGLIDGDGCISVNKRKKVLSISSSNKQDWKYVETKCIELNIINNIYRYNTTKGSYSCIEMNGVNSKKFGDYIYQDYLNDRIGLQRKYNKYEIISEAINNHEEKLFIADEKKKKAKELYKKEIPITQIMKELSLPSTTVRRWLKYE